MPGTRPTLTAYILLARHAKPADMERVPPHVAIFRINSRRIANSEDGMNGISRARDQTGSSDRKGTQSMHAYRETVLWS